MPETSFDSVNPSTADTTGRQSPVVGPGVHVGALDGLRGLAVVAVVAYHLWPGTVPGGWLGVSLFFTLSGFLVVGLLDHELTAGHLDLRHFYRRRVRRLLPAGLTTIGIVVVATSLTYPDSAQRVAVDGFWAVLNSANWHQMLGSDGYEAIFDQTVKPLAHMWSLAIEEQFYLSIPLLIAWTKRPVMVVGTGAVVAVIGQLVWWGSSDSYFASPVRIAEIVAGAALALAVRRRPAVLAAGKLWMPAAAASLWMVLTMKESSSIVFRGLPALMSVAWVILVLGCLQPGRFSRAMSMGIWRWLGLRSYAIYLIHWPLIVLTDMNPVSIILVTLLLAEISYRLIEDPIRTGRRITRPIVTLVGAGLALTAVTGVLSLELHRPLGLADSAAAEALPDWVGVTTTIDSSPVAITTSVPLRTVAAAATTSTTTTTTTSTLPPIPAVPIVAVIGDSTATQVAAGLRAYGDSTHDLAAIDGSVSGCSALIDPLTQWRTYNLTSGFLGPFEFEEPCRSGLDALAAVPDLVIVIDHGSVLADHERLDGSWASVLDADLMSDLRLVYGARIAEALQMGAVIVFATAPQILDPEGHGLFGDMLDVDRLEVYNQFITELAASETNVEVFDLGSILDESGSSGTYPRSDGLHVDLDATEVLAADVIAPHVDDWLRSWIDVPAERLAGVAKGGLARS